MFRYFQKPVFSCEQLKIHSVVFLMYPKIRLENERPTQKIGYQNRQIFVLMYEEKKYIFLVRMRSESNRNYSFLCSALHSIPRRLSLFSYEMKAYRWKWNTERLSSFLSIAHLMSDC